MTHLSKPVHRVSSKAVNGKNIVLTLAPGGEKRPDLIGLRLKGTRVQYVVTVPDVYRIAALWHGQKEAAAKKQARKDGIPWRQARRAFLRANSVS